MSQCFPVCSNQLTTNNKYSVSYKSVILLLNSYIVFHDYGSTVARLHWASVNPIHECFTGSISAGSKSSRLSIYEKGGGNTSRQPWVGGGMPGSQSSPSSSLLLPPRHQLTHSTALHVSPSGWLSLDNWVWWGHFKVEAAAAAAADVSKWDTRCGSGVKIQNWWHNSKTKTKTSH